MPVYSSAQTIWQIGPAQQLLGNNDFIFCSGGGIMSHPGGVAQGVSALREAAEATRLGISLEDFANKGTPLYRAMGAFPKPFLQTKDL